MKQTLNILLFCTVVILLAVVTGCCHDKIEVSATPVASAMPSQNPCLKVFIENFGSMDGYMCDGSQLKDVVYDYISDLNRLSSKTELYYINSKLIPYNGNLTNYIKALNPAAFKKGVSGFFRWAGESIKSIVLSLHNETRSTAQSHPTRSPDRQLRY